MHKRASGSRIPSRIPLTALLVVLTLALVAAGCGGDDDESGTSGGTATEGSSSGGDETLAVSMTDFAFDPADPTVNAGTVTIEATNDGETTHTIEVEGPSGESVLEPVVDPGQSGELEVDLGEPGTYEWYCPIGNHRSAGMEGEITVEG